jgi:hypothetical protein
MQVVPGAAEDGVALFWLHDSMRLEAKQEALYRCDV